MTHKLVCLLSTVLVLAACGHKSESNQTTADAEATPAVTLEIVSTLEGEGHFRLTNPTQKPIAFESTQETSDGAYAEHTQLQCRRGGSDEWETGPRAMGDSPTTRIEVPPGSDASIVVLWEPGLLQAYEGGGCRVDLRLADGSLVRSGEF